MNFIVLNWSFVKGPVVKPHPANITNTTEGIKDIKRRAVTVIIDFSTTIFIKKPPYFRNAAS